MNKTIIFSLGSNLGIRRANIEYAIYLLSQSHIISSPTICISSIYETKALLPQNAPKEWDIPYLNAVFTAELTADAQTSEEISIKLLHLIKHIEMQMGRKPSPNWSPRPIDIDILAVGNISINSPILTIPHKLMFEREFVLQPLAEIYPKWITATTPRKRNISNLLNNKLPIYSHQTTIDSIINRYKAKQTKLVGILNITPDSFSDGGEYASYEQAINQTQKLLNDGADIIDIGAESTRPNATPLTHDQEWNRLKNILPDVINLVHKANKQVAIDTYHPQTALKGIKLGIDWINDVTGFENPVMIEAVKKSNCGLVVMHSLGVPADKSKTISKKQNTIQYLINYATKQIEYLQKSGIDLHRITFDAGIGFGKTPKQSLDIILQINKLKQLRVPLYIGHSRKSFLKLFSNDIIENKDSLTLSFSSQLIQQNTEFLRIHNIALHTELLLRITSNNG